MEFYFRSIIILYIYMRRLCEILVISCVLKSRSCKERFSYMLEDTCSFYIFIYRTRNICVSRQTNDRSQLWERYMCMFFYRDSLCNFWVCSIVLYSKIVSSGIELRVCCQSHKVVLSEIIFDIEHFSGSQFCPRNNSRTFYIGKIFTKSIILV